MTTETETRIHNLLVEHLGVDAAQVTTDASLVDDLGADSLDLVELEMALEEEFGFRFPSDDGTLEMTHTVGDVIRLVDENRDA